MGGGGTSSSGNQFGFQNTTSTYSPDPMAYNYLMGVLNAGANVGGIPYTPYTGQQLAGFSQDQLAGMQAVREATGAAQPYLDQATQLAAQAYNLSSPSNFSQAAVSQYLNPMMTDFINKTPTVFTQAAADQYLDPRLQSIMNLLPTQYSTAAAAQYQDPTIQNMINALPTGYSQDYANQFMSPQLKAYLEGAPLQYSPEAVSKYYNPYQESVINATKAQIEQQNAQQMAQQQAQAIQSGAFGGDRSGAARAQLAGQQSLAQNQTLGALRQQGYQQALAAFQQQQAQALGIASQQQALGVNQFNTQQALRSALAQQQAQQQMEMFSRQQGLGIDIAKQQAQQKLQQFNQQQAAALNAQQQSYAQALAQYNQQQQQAIQAAQQASYGLSQLGAQAQQAQLQGAQALLGSGQLQQQLDQQQLNNQYSQWLAAQSYPYMQTAFMAGLGSLAPGLGGTTNTSGFGYGSSNQQQSGGSAAGQIGGAVSSLAGLIGMFSDERAKTNIDYIGEDPKSGYPIYAYDYKSDVKRSEETGKPMPPKRMGPMAQDVAERDPEHSIDLGGLLGIKLDRDHKADGGQTKMVPIQTYTGQAAPSTGITDLSSLAYQTNPNFPVDMTQGLGDLFTPMEEYEKIGRRWISPDIKSDEVELKPYKARHEDREERAVGGGMLPDQSDFLEMSKTPPYGLLSNPKVASAMLPIRDLPEHRPQTPDLGYIPGLPGGARSMSGGSGGGGGGGEAPSIPKLKSKGKEAAGLGSLGSTGTEKTDAAKPEADKAEPSFLDKLKGGIGDIFSGGAQAPAAPAAPDVSAAGGDMFGGIGNMFSGLFSHGGRAERADGGGLPGFGGITGSQIGPITNPYGSGQVGGYPAGVGAFNVPINTGISVQQAFGPRGLGRDISQSLANFRMPWTAVNTGSPTYNNLLLQASKNIGPRQLTPQEFGMPSIAQASANYAGSPTARVPTQAQIDATTDEVEKANLQNQLDLSNLKGKYPNLASTPSNYIYQMTDMMTPQGLKFMVPVSGYSSPGFYVNPFAKSQPQYKADGGSVREGYRQGGRPGLWGRLQDAEESARAAALALKEDAMHPQEVLHSIWNRVKSGAYGETPSDVMTQRRQYEPMNPSNRGTSRDPRTVNPNDPKVRELADYWSKIKAGQVEDPTGGATHFMNPDIVGQRRHGHFKPWERAGLNDPASVRVGQQIFYNPNRNAPVAADRPKGDYFSNLKPPVPYGPGDMSVLAGGQGKYGEPISPASAPLNDTFGKGLDLSGGAMNMREMSDVYPVEPPGVAGRNIGAGDRELSIGQLSGLPSLADPATPGTYSPPLNVGGTDVQTAMGNERPKGFADVPPTLGQPTSEADKITEVHDGRHPMVKTTAVAHPRPGTHVIAEKSTGFGPVARDTAKKGEEGGFDLESMLGDVFGGKDAGYLQGPDLGDLADLLGFNAGGRVGYEGGGDVDPLDVYMAALAKGESGGEKDPYRTIGPASRKGDRPYGKYQIMGENIPAWSEEAGVGRITPEEFLASDKLQEQIARHKYGQYLKETGSPEKAAAMWFGGPNYASHMGAKDVLGTSIPQYMASFKSRLGEGDGGGGSSRVVATDRGDEGSDDTFGGLRHMLGGDKEAGTGLFGMKPLMNRDLAMYLLATGSGMMASRNKSPLAAFGEGSMQGIEALQASQAMRANEGLKGLQAANLMSEIQKRNFELNELIRRTRARQQLLGGAGGEGAPKAVPPVSQDTGVAPGAMPTTPEAPKIIEGTPAAPAAAPEAKPAPVSPEIPVSGAPKEEAMKPDPFDAEMAKVTADEKLNRQKAQQAIDLGIPEDAKQFEDRADKARDRVEKLMEQKRQSLTQKVDEGSPMGQYSATQKAAASAVDRQHILKDLEATINDKSVDFGIAAPYLNMLKSGAAEAEEYFPGLKKILPPVNTEALARAEELGAEANNIILSFTNGKLGGGVTDADMRILRDTTFNVSKTREYNMNVLRKAEAVQEKVKAAAEEQERYRQAHGGLDANFQDHMSKWGKEHPVQSYMRKEAEHKAGQIGEKEAPVAKDTQSPLDALKSRYPSMTEDQLRTLYKKLKGGE